MDVALPPALQLPLTLGDRYLAANIEVFRAMVLDVADPKKKYLDALAKVQQSASTLNPAHEDNYYIAQAILPWNGAVDANQYIQERAKDSRPWDFLPGFFAAFNNLYFYQDPQKAGEILYSVAGRQPKHKEAIIELAARWQEKGRDLDAAIQVVQAMEKQTRSPALKKNLQMRVERLQGLRDLREAAERYKKEFGHSPISFESLLATGMLLDIPNDPFGDGYTLDQNGVPVIMKHRSGVQQQGK